MTEKFLTQVKPGDNVWVEFRTLRHATRVVRLVHKVTAKFIVIGRVRPEYFSRTTGRLNITGSQTYVTKKATAEECREFDEAQRQAAKERKAKAAAAVETEAQRTWLGSLFGGRAVIRRSASLDKFDVEFPNMTEIQVRRLATLLEEFEWRL